MTACDQCGKPAVYEVHGHPICIDCNLKLQQAFQIRDNALKEQVNFLLDQAEAITGIYGVTPRYKIAHPVIHQGSMNFHTINVDRSVVGAINTGTVRKMEVALNDIHLRNENAALETQLKEFTEGILREASLSVEAKNEIIEQLSFIAEQIAVPKESRITAVMKGLVANIAANVAATGLVNHWTAIRHMIGL